MKIMKTLAVSALMSGIIAGSSRAEEGLLLSDASRSDGTSFADQLRSAGPGQIVLINTFEVAEGQAEAFQAGWERVADVLRRQPGFVSTTLHKPVGSSRLWVNYAVWESASALAGALAGPDFRAAAGGMKQTGFRRLYQAMPVLGPLK